MPLFSQTHHVGLMPELVQNILEVCDPKTLLTARSASCSLRQLGDKVLRGRAARALSRVFPQCPAKEMLAFLHEIGGGVIGSVALAVWHTADRWSPGGLDISVPKGELDKTLLWLKRRNLETEKLDIAFEYQSVTRSRFHAWDGKSHIYIYESVNSSCFTPLLQGSCTLQMNLLTKNTIYALYPNATFAGRGMWGVGDPNRSFERKAKDVGLIPSFYSLCDGHCGNECEGSLRRLSDSSAICAVSLMAEKDKVKGLSKDDILMVLEWKLWPDLNSVG